MKLGGEPTQSSFDDPYSVEKWELVYDKPRRPEETVVTDPLGVETTYQIDWTDPKPRVTEVSGDCPTCGLGPNSQVYYFDGANPLRPSREINGRGLVTEMAYDLNGQLTSKIEAFGTALERETLWEYNANFPAFPTRIEQPSSTGNPLDLRITTFTYDPLTGDQESRSIEGIEAGSAFFYETTMTYNAAGQTESIDLPGHGTDDETSFSYDPARGNLVAADRTDPLIGTTVFGYDPFNRRTSVTDPNDVTTETVYDALNRVRFVIQKGASPSDDLVTEHRYSVFGDLFQTILPEGNVIEYTYDLAGRLVAIERKPDDNPSSHGERVFYELDDFGHRIREEQQRWNGGAWAVDAATEYEYSTRCHLERMIQGAGSAAESVTEYQYDCNGNLERVWDANHPSNAGVNPPTTTYAYDDLDRLTSVTQPWSAGGSVVTGYAYDVQDHLTAVTDGEGNTTPYTYSDRDLLTEENSPVSGATAYDYDDHGELISETDARGVTVLRTVDALDRVTFVDYPDNSLDIVFTYDDPSVAFSKGRLTQILRDGHAVDYEYDRFGRTTRDGDLQILFDKNGNRVEIGYPGGVSALYTFDFADREKTLDVEIPGAGVEAWVTDASYYASGPLQLLDFANGVQETRTHDQRYFPDQILAAGPSSTHLHWQYTTDDVGNITLIDDLLSPSDRIYGYQDYQYFLTSGNGPWGNLSWSYDRIGNRLSETRDGVTDIYSYVPGASGNNPKLSQISLGSGGTEIFSYDAIGSQTQIVTASETTDYIYGDDKRLIAIALASGEARTDFAYDGRSFLRSSVPSRPVEVFMDGFESGHLGCWTNSVGGPVGGTCPSGPRTEPTYSSEGLLMHLRHDDGARDRYILYFAGRPVGILGLEAGTPSRMVVTADHLGTPILGSDEAGGAVWGGGFEPFGADFGGAGDVEMFLRFPGQWKDGTWVEEGLYYNVYRSYQTETGTYNRPDPLGIERGGPQLYLYGGTNPLSNIDPDGLYPRACKPDDVKWCQQQCQKRRTRFAGCQCFGVPFCFGLLDYAVAVCKKWQDGCSPCPPPPPVIDYEHGHGPCKPGQGHYHYFEYHQSPPPQCFCRLVRRFGGCL